MVLNYDENSPIPEKIAVSGEVSPLLDGFRNINKDQLIGLPIKQNDRVVGVITGATDQCWLGDMESRFLDSFKHTTSSISIEISPNKHKTKEEY